MNHLAKLQKEFLALRHEEKSKHLSRFFKTGKGDYGEGDVFYGLTVPQTRQLAKKFSNLNLEELGALIKSEVHEARLCALLILVEKYEGKKTSEEEKKEIKEFYLANTKYINNWDLVDLSCHHILGEWLWRHLQEREVFEKLANSKHLWEKRIAIVSTYYFIREKRLDETFEIAKVLLNDTHDLIHKAVGWMLREAGKRNLEAEEEFLKKNYKKMPRTMLRYAIERFPEKKRQEYLKGSVP